MINIKPVISKQPHRNRFTYYDSKTRQTILCSGFQIDYYDPISRKRRRHTEQIPYEKVIELCERMKQNQYQGIDTITNQLAKIKLQSLSSLFDKYKKRKTRRSVSPDTTERAKRAMNTLIHFTNDIAPGQIDAEVVDHYIKNELNRGLKPGGINTNLRHLKAIFKWAKETGLIKNNPLKNTNPLETEETQIRVLSESEFKRFISVIDDEFYKTLIWCYLLTGARRSELLSPKLSWKHVDLEQGVMFILVKGNGKKRRRVTLATPLIDMLNALKKTNPESEYPFDVDGSTVYRKIQKYYKAAKIPIRKPGFENLHVHSLRKTYATMLAKSGVSVYVLKDLMRHSRISVTEEYYLNIGDEFHRKILDDFSKSIR